MRSKFHTLMTPSSAPVANRSSLGAQVASRIASPWPWNTWRLFMFCWKYLITPALSALRSHWPECDHERARTAESCACEHVKRACVSSGSTSYTESARLERREGAERTWRIVSKLNVSPFQSVNSPEVEPVKMRRASGVNCETSESACTLSSRARPTIERGRSDAR